MIIGHRGAAGIAPENSLASMQAGIDDGSDIIEFDVRLTADDVPVVIHDSDLKRTHKLHNTVRSLTLDELIELNLDPRLPTLDEVLDQFLGKTVLNIEIKSRGMTGPVLDLLKLHCGNSKDKWDTVLVSSYLAKELLSFRKQSTKANLALLHSNNPFLYIAYQRRINFTAVGFHRLHLNQLATAIANKAEIFTYVYTVDRPKSVHLLEKQGIDGIVTNYPSKIAEAIEQN